MLFANKFWLMHSVVFVIFAAPLGHCEFQHEKTRRLLILIQSMSQIADCVRSFLRLPWPQLLVVMMGCMMGKLKREKKLKDTILRKLTVVITCRTHTWPRLGRYIYSWDHFETGYTKWWDIWWVHGAHVLGRPLWWWVLWTLLPQVMKDIWLSCVVDNKTYEELEGKNSREHPEPDESTPLIHYPVQSNLMLRFFLFCFVYLCLFIIFRSESWCCCFDSLLFDSYCCHTIDS